MGYKTFNPARLALTTHHPPSKKRSLTNQNVMYCTPETHILFTSPIHIQKPWHNLIPLFSSSCSLFSLFFSHAFPLLSIISFQFIFLQVPFQVVRQHLRRLKLQEIIYIVCILLEYDLISAPIIRVYCLVPLL